MNIKSGIHRAVLLAVCCSFALPVFAADSVTGKVRNQTTNKPVAGDEVVLLRLENGMEEESRTRTDAQGAFVLALTNAGARHLVRVLHQKVNYDQSLAGSGPLEIAVFDAVSRIEDLQGRLGMAQVESDGQMLKITEMYAIANESVPPVTQAGPRNFEISIPAKATLDSVVVKKGGGVWVNITPNPISGQQGRYAIDFPIRPGETLFKFIYHLSGTDRATLHIQPPYPIRSFAVMHPPSMTFKSSNPQAFTSPGVARGLKVEQAVSKPVVRTIPDFEVSGTGLAPPLTQDAKSSTVENPSAAAGSHAPAAAPSAQPSAQGESANGTWIILTGVGALVVACMYAVFKKRRKTVSNS